MGSVLLPLVISVPRNCFAKGAYPSDIFIVINITIKWCSFS